jgi:hypothetical protein
MFKLLAAIGRNRTIRSEAPSGRMNASAGSRRTARRMNAMVDRIGQQEDRG